MKKGYIELAGVIGAVIVSVALIFKEDTDTGAYLFVLVLGYVFGTAKNIIAEFRNNERHKAVFGW